MADRGIQKIPNHSGLLQRLNQRTNQKDGEKHKTFWDRALSGYRKNKNKKDK